MGRGCWHFIKQHAYGDEETLPDHSRLSWMLALITINMDLSVPVLYTAIIETSYGCDVFTLYGIYYGLSQANFLMPIVCGWLVDFLGSWSHIVLIVSSVFLSLLQIATLVTNSTWLLGAIFLGRQWIINQAVVQSYKLMAIRTHKTYKDDEDKKEQECQRTGATADFWTSFGEAVAYAIVYFLPGQWSRYVLVIIAVASTMIVAFISATYRQADLLHDVEGAADVRGDGTSVVGRRASGSTGSVGRKASGSETGKRKTSMIRVSNAAEGESLLNEDTPSCRDRVRYYCNCSCRRGSPLRDLFDYLLGAKEFFTNFMIFIPFMHYLVLQLFRAMVTLPLNQNEANDLPSVMPGVCDGLLKNIYLQGFFSQVFYLIGSILYLRFVALLSPYSYFLFVYTGLAVVFGGLAAVFYLPNVSVWVGATVLAIMNTASYYGTEFDTWYLMSVVDDKMYGYFTVVSGIGLSLTGIIASGFMTFNISNQMVLLCSQGMAALTIIMSIFFAVAGKSRLQALGEHHGDGDADDFAKLDGGEGGAASSDADSSSGGKPRSTSRSSGRKDRAGSRGAVPP